jgi:hypothetical protein
MRCAERAAASPAISIQPRHPAGRHPMIMGDQLGQLPLTLQLSPLLHGICGAGQHVSWLPPHVASQPFAGFSSSSRWPCWQLAYVHAVPLHAIWFAKSIVAGEHAALQAPQLVAVRMFVSQPLLSAGGRQ